MSQELPQLNKMVEENRKGTVCVPDVLFQTMDDHTWSQIFKRLRIVRCEFLYAFMMFEYVCYCSEFESVETGEVCPRYVPEFKQKDNKNIFIGFKKSEA